MASAKFAKIVLMSAFFYYFYTDFSWPAQIAVYVEEADNLRVIQSEKISTPISHLTGFVQQKLINAPFVKEMSLGNITSILPASFLPFMLMK